MLSQHTTHIQSFPRSWSKVTLANPDECWNWTASLAQNGYGQFWLDGKLVLAHRVAYELMIGHIPEGQTIDHLCRNRKCENPRHLEPVTHRENVLRGVSPVARNAVKTHCKKGHAYDLGNTYIRPNGGRDCRICRRVRNKNI